MLSEKAAPRGPLTDAGARGRQWFSERLRLHPGFWSVLVVLLLTVPALTPLFLPGIADSHDGRFHLYRIAGLARAWGDGVLHPRLLPEFGFGYGQAVLNYYPPLSYWPGAVLASLGLSPVVAFDVTVALAIVLAALVAYGYASSLWGRWGGLLAAVAYTYFPYHLADAYQRGAIPELWSFVWVPLILWTATPVLRSEVPKSALLWHTLAWAALAYTHSLTTLLMIPVWMTHILFVAGSIRRWARLWPLAGFALLAAGLSAPQWIPLFAESPAVGLGLGPSSGYRDHLLPLSDLFTFSPAYPYAERPSAGVDYPVSWTSLLVLVGAVFAWALARARRRRLPHGSIPYAFGMLLFGASAAMTTTGSAPVWRALEPALAHLQYPYRFNIFVGLGLMLLAGALPGLVAASSLQPEPSRVRGRWWLTSAALIALLVVHAVIWIPRDQVEVTDTEVWTSERMWAEDAQAGQVGATWTGEFLPVTVQEQRWALGLPAEGAVDGPAMQPEPSVQVAVLGHTTVSLRVETSEPFELRLHQFYLPAWRCALDGSAVETRPSGALGLLTLSVPPGPHEISCRFGPSRSVVAGQAVSALSAGLWCGLALVWRRKRALLGWAPCILGLLAIVLVLNGLGLGGVERVPQPADATIGDVAQLVGYATERARGVPALDVTLYWFALREVGTDYKTFVHLLDAQGSIVTQHDGDPGGGYTPTTRWMSGEIIPDRHRLLLPPGLPAANYALKAGMYQAQPLANLPVQPPTDDGRVDLGMATLP